MEPTRRGIDVVPLATQPARRGHSRLGGPTAGGPAEPLARPTREAMQAGERAVAALAEGAMDGMAIVSLDGTVRTWNPAATRLLGIEERDAIGARVTELVAPAQRPAARRHDPRPHAPGRAGPVHVAVPDRGAAGELRHLAVTLAPLRGADGRPEAVAVIARDITELRRLRQARARLRAELAQARRAASLGRLVQSVAHDFNNVLAAIHGYATIAAADLEGRRLEDQLEIIRAAERGSDLARRLLAQSRRSPSMPVPVAIDDALGGCARMLRRLLPAGVELALRLEADAAVAMDPVEVDQVLMNLVLNARDALDEAGLILVETSCEDARVPPGGAPGRRAVVLLNVTDTGPGMDSGVRERAFEPYFTTKDPGEGTGLGLATVREIVERAGGTIVLGTAPGGGTAVQIRIPVAE